MTLPDPRHAFHHATSLPLHFFGRERELAALDAALEPGGPGVVAFVGPGGQGKTALVQHWLADVVTLPGRVAGVFLWSFYRGKDADLCLRALHAHVTGEPEGGDRSATSCVDRLLPRLRREAWVIVLDGAEVVQYERGPWYGRFVHPELGRLVDDLATEPAASVILVTTRFPVAGLEHRRYGRVVGLDGLDAASARSLLTSLGVSGSTSELDAAAELAGRHAKAVELLGTFLVHARDGRAADALRLPDIPHDAGLSDSEQRVACVLAAHAGELADDVTDLLALTTAFRDPQTPHDTVAYLLSDLVRELLHTTWGRTYVPIAARGADWVYARIDDLVARRLLERVGRRPGETAVVLDAHPLVRRSFEHRIGAAGRRDEARSRAGFLSGRPDRRKPATLDEAREEVELFHALCDAGLWAEADVAYLGLDAPRYRFVAPSLDRDMLLRFFPAGDPRQPPLWPRFCRYRELAVSLEMMGLFEAALTVYREADAALRGDALLALGRLEPILAVERSAHPWQMLWGAYRVHALSLSGRFDEAADLASSLVPMDVYEWSHVFEGLWRAGRLDALEVRGFLERPSHRGGHRWAELARERMRLDLARLDGETGLRERYQNLVEAYDRAGLPWERVVARLGQARVLDGEACGLVLDEAAQLARRYGMVRLEADARGYGRP